MTEQTLTGSCLCGSLAYSLTGEPALFFHCHCSRCRKSSGTGHASNLFVKNAEVAWSGDTELIKNYKLPEATRFSRSFCTNCGGAVPMEIPDAKMVFVPAGTLNDEPNIAPQARIFYESKTNWSCASEDIPCFQEYST